MPTELVERPLLLRMGKLPLDFSPPCSAVTAASPAARWLTRQRLCCQRKKIGKLRPIKMGEFLFVNQHQVVRCEALRVHQVSVYPAPAKGRRSHGGERLLLFGDAEWAFPADTVVTFATNRGTGQGDVLGAVQSALVLGRA